jgi:hypothetical protein
MSYFPSIYDPSIIVEIEDMSYFPPIYDPTFGKFYYVQYHIRRTERRVPSHHRESDENPKD